MIYNIAQWRKLYSDQLKVKYPLTPSLHQMLVRYVSAPSQLRQIRSPLEKIRRTSVFAGSQMQNA